MLGRHGFKLLSAAIAAGAVFWYWTRPEASTPGVHLRLGIEALKNYEYAEAEQQFRAELQLVEGQPVASEQLAIMLIQSGRRWEASKYIQTVLGQERVLPDSLILVTGDPGKSIRQPMLVKWHEQDPPDTAPLVGLAKIALANEQTDEARNLLRQVLSVNPNDLEAHVVSGEVVCAISPSELPAWNNNLPEAAALHPGIWFVRGDWCELSGNAAMAARCFVEGLRLEPNDHNACLRLGQLLGPDRGAPFLERAEFLQQMFDLTERMQRGSLSQVWSLVETARSLGRVREAAHWARTAMMVNPQLMMRMSRDVEFSAMYREIMDKAKTGEDLNPAAKLNLSDFPDWCATEIPAVPPETAAVRRTGL